MTTRSRWLSLALAGLLVTGCGIERYLPILPSPSASDGGQDPACFGINEMVDRDPYTVENLLRVADWIVIADIVGIGAAHWDTPGGAPPEPGVRPRAGFDPGILTPVDVVVRQVAVGEGPVGAMRAVIEGGTVGCVVHTIDPAPPVVVPGNRYALVMVPSRDATGAEHPEQPLVLEAWPIDANGDIVTTFDGTITIEELAAMAGG